MIVYQGPSMFDGKEIVVIVTGLGRESKNAKTGDLVQTWVLATDEAPNALVKSQGDFTVCGDCPFAGGRGCYVRSGEAPLSIWRAFRRGRYESIAGDLDAIAALGADRTVRLGAYGDPAAVPVEIWEALVSRSKAHTGYTHAWRRLTDRRWRRLVMASCELQIDRSRASLLGWRTFRVADDEESRRLAGEMTCPASAEAGKVRNCADCHACDGTRGEGLSNRDVTIRLHGATTKRAQAAIASLRTHDARVFYA